LKVLGISRVCREALKSLEVSRVFGGGGTSPNCWLRNSQQALFAKRIDRSGGCCLSRCGGGDDDDDDDDDSVESFLLQVKQVGSRSTRKVTKGGRKKKKKKNL
jgi:hypothetical protein